MHLMLKGDEMWVGLIGMNGLHCALFGEKCRDETYPTAKFEHGIAIGNNILARR